MKHTSDEQDISHADILEAVNNGFTRMQEQFNALQATEARHHSENQQEHAEIHAEISVLSKKLNQTVAVTDEHDRLIQKFAQ